MCRRSFGASCAVSMRCLHLLMILAVRSITVNTPAAIRNASAISVEKQIVAEKVSYRCSVVRRLSFICRVSEGDCLPKRYLTKASQLPFNYRAFDAAICVFSVCVQTFSHDYWRVGSHL
ncbi:hypothetical protein BCR34DRAFT_360836 [Clohesyomyces aquaticus]|uniref:Secreted protein n=1 Tax=Clohesyomyces aquaticus TaxID=1231657 RepID=A0A1Y2A6Q6_9PLEO|nr:hypothetical protein BCR34DRAFT_360836 [Clohesyomyces aquaticus]